MSQENVEIVRALWSALERFEVPPDAFADDVEWNTAADMPDSETCKGVKAIQQMPAVGWENVVDPGLAAEELIDAGERVVVRWRGWGRGRASGLPVDWRETHIYELRNGKVVAVGEYRSWLANRPIAFSVCRRFGRVVANRWPQSASDRAG